LESFYFTSYERVIGAAGNIRELDKEMKRLAREDRGALEYHLASGHIVSWLEYTNEPQLAKNLGGVKNIEEAIRVVESYVARSYMIHSMRRGRMH
jgi:hypothetical protein